MPFDLKTEFLERLTYFGRTPTVVEVGVATWVLRFSRADGTLAGMVMAFNCYTMSGVHTVVFYEPDQIKEFAKQLVQPSFGPDALAARTEYASLQLFGRLRKQDVCTRLSACTDL